MNNTNTSKTSSKKIFIYGLTGRMGREISALIEEVPEFTLVGGTSKSSPQSLVPCDVILDFSHPDALKDNLAEAVALRVPILVGTTGLTATHRELMEEASEEIPVMVAPNTSLGIAVLKNLVLKAASQLDQSYDIEIFEAHHRHKVDAPSGTALDLGKAAEYGRMVNSDDILEWKQPGKSVNLPLDRQGARPVGPIGYAVQRGGGIIGDHSVRFISDEEVIELSHRSLSRRLLARGALRAATWLVDNSHGQPGYYTMDDILGE